MQLCFVVYFLSIVSCLVDIVIASIAGSHNHLAITRDSAAAVAAVPCGLGQNDSEVVTGFAESSSTSVNSNIVDGTSVDTTDGIADTVMDGSADSVCVTVDDLDCTMEDDRTVRVVVVGSMNVDTFLPVDRLPVAGENLTIRRGCSPILNVPGGKGCTQAIAASKLLSTSKKTVSNSIDLDAGQKQKDDESMNRTCRTHKRRNFSGVAFVGQFGTTRNGCSKNLHATSASVDSTTKTKDNTNNDDRKDTASDSDNADNANDTSNNDTDKTDDTGRKVMYDALVRHKVHIIGYGTISKVHKDLDMGRGYVFQTSNGQVSAVVSSGANGNEGWERVWEKAYRDYCEHGTFNAEITPILQQIFPTEGTDGPIVAGAVMLQCEIPEYVNAVIALYCKELRRQSHSTSKRKKSKLKWIVALDLGGADRPILCPDLLPNCDFVMPNEIELKRVLQWKPPSPQTATLPEHLQSTSSMDGHNSADNASTDSDGDVVAMARKLQQLYGAKNVLVTQGSQGSTLVLCDEESMNHENDCDNIPPASTVSTVSTVLFEPPCCLESNDVVDETGAGDCYRAAFISQLLLRSNGAATTTATTDSASDTSSRSKEQQQHLQMLKECMEFASAAGACSVERNGAIPSTPTRTQVLERVKLNRQRQQYKILQNQRQEHEVTIEKQEQQQHHPMGQTIHDLRGGVSNGIRNNDTFQVDDDDDDGDDDEDIKFPFLIGSRLNSMKDRPELYYNTDNNDNHYDHQQPNLLTTPADFVQRQSKIRGLTCVDFNYPQHFYRNGETSSNSYWTDNNNITNNSDITNRSITGTALDALQQAGLVAGAVCLRYPSPKFVRGAMNHPDPIVRNDAIQLTKDAAQAAMELGCNEVVVWSAFDGYDYPFQVNYNEKWDQLVSAFQECCDAYPAIKFSLEYKPTDENTRFFTVPSTGAAILLCQAVNRTNFGLTLDVGHMLMAGENPAQSIAMVCHLLNKGIVTTTNNNKLFGIQLNDGYTRLAAEDGLMFGSIHPSMALEIMYQLIQTNFSGHLYFDTFPQRTDPVQEAEYNIRRVKAFWKAAMVISKQQQQQQQSTNTTNKKITNTFHQRFPTNQSPSKHLCINRITKEHDAVGALELVNNALRNM